jgi:hypothetical protein
MGSPEGFLSGLLLSIAMIQSNCSLAIEAKEQFSRVRGPDLQFYFRAIEL